MKTKLFIFFILFLILTGRIALGYNLPLPESTIKQDEQRIEFNGVPYNSEVYQSSLSAEEIAFFFKEKLPSEGFILMNENKVLNTLIFTNFGLKENFLIELDNSKIGLTHFRVTFWKADLFNPTNPATSDKDSEGDDLAGIPRYPGSIRVSNVNSGRTKVVCYRTLQSKEDIVSFYESRMPSYGWKKFSQTNLVKQEALESIGQGIAPDAELLIFEKNNFICCMVVGPEVKCSEGSCIEQENSKNNVISIAMFSRAAD